MPREKPMPKLRVLLVADDRDGPQFVEEFQGTSGTACIELTHAGTCSKALAQLENPLPDAIVLDLGTPVSRGLETLRKIHAAVPTLAIVALSPNDNVKTDMRAMKEGAQDCLDKKRFRGSVIAPILLRAIERQLVSNQRLRHTENLRISRENLTAVIDGSGDAILVCDAEGIVVFANPAARKLFQRTHRELLGTELGFPTVSGKTTEIEVLTGRKQISTAEMRVGDILWEGAPARLVFLHDITDRLAAEQKLEAANRALTESEGRLKAFMNASPESLFLKDLRGRYTAVNGAFLTRRGLSHDQVVGHTTKRVLGKALGRNWEENDRSVLTSHKVGYFIVDDFNETGRRLVERVVKFPITDADGNVMGLGGMSFDITPLISAQEALERSNRFFRTLSACNEALVRSESEGDLLREICKSIVERGGFPHVWVGYNDESQEILHSVACHGTVTDPRASSDVSYSDRCPIAMAARTGKFVVVRDGFDNPDCADCREFSETHGFQSTISLPLFSADSLVGVLTIYAVEPDRFDNEEVLLLTELAGDLSYGILARRDAIERERAERELIKLSRAVEQSPAMVMIADAKGVIEYVNPKVTAVTGYVPAEIIGHTPRILSSGERTPEAYKEMWETLLAGREWRGIFHNKCKDGSLYWGETAISPIFDTEGKITHFVAVQEDVTERRLTEQSLLQAEKMDALGQLAGGIAHDFNNMLLPIRTLTQMTLDKLPDEDPARRRLEKVVEAASRAQELVRKIMTYGRSEEDTDRKELDISAVIHSAVDLLRSTLPATTTIVEKIDTGIGVVVADSAQIQTVVLNLGKNASDAMEGRPGTLSFGLERVLVDGVPPATVTPLGAGNYAKLIVADTGSGMDEATMARIFEPFFTTKEVGKGTGLGMAMVHGIITKFGGSIAIESESGKGATFVIYLPVVEVD